MLHIENSRIDSQPVDTIKGQQNTGTVFVKPLLRGAAARLPDEIEELEPLNEANDHD